MLSRKLTLNILFLLMVSGASSQIDRLQLLRSLRVTDSVRAKNFLPSAGGTPSTYYPLYMGPLQARIAVSHRSDLSTHNIPWYHRAVNYRQPQDSDIRMEILTRDTIAIIDENNSRKVTYKAHPVVLCNMSEDTLILGYSMQLPCYLEALASDSRYKKLQRPFSIECANKMGRWILPPGHIIICPLAISGGDYKTRVRLVFGQWRSNEIKASINSVQLGTYD